MKYFRNTCGTQNTISVFVDFVEIIQASRNEGVFTKTNTAGTLQNVRLFVYWCGVIDSALVMVHVNTHCVYLTTTNFENMTGFQTVSLSSVDENL